MKNISKKRKYKINDPYAFANFESLMEYLGMACGIENIGNEITINGILVNSDIMKLSPEEMDYIMSQIDPFYHWGDSEQKLAKVKNKIKKSGLWNESGRFIGTYAIK